MKVPCQNKPCRNCPFRKDSLKGWLGKERITSILNSDSFTCHKNNNLQCAGFILVNKENSAFLKFSSSINIDLQLKGKQLVFESIQECINHHSE